MRSTGIERRRLLRAAAGFSIGGLGIGGLGLGLGFAAPGMGAFNGSRAAERRGQRATPAVYVAARQEAEGRHVAAVFDLDAGDGALVPLPGRGHDVAVCRRTGTFVVFARRPGRFAIAVQPGREPAIFTTPDDRHFNGHGVFSPAGDLLYATENDFIGQRGVLGLYRCPGRHDRAWRRIGELPTFGIGPHELGLLPDGDTLAIANGGILTDPGVGDGRSAIGRGVQADLVLIDRRRGDRLGQWRLPPNWPTSRSGIWRWIEGAASGSAASGRAWPGRHRRCSAGSAHKEHWRWWRPAPWPATWPITWAPSSPIAPAP